MHKSIMCQKTYSASAVEMAAGLLLVRLNTRKNRFAFITFPQVPISAHLQQTRSVAELQLQWGRDGHPCACESCSDL